MVKVKKMDGRIEEFTESKIVESIRKAGATAEEAVEVAKKIVEKIADNTEAVLESSEVTTEILARMVVDELKKVNKSVADEFDKFRNAKLTDKKKKI